MKLINAVLVFTLLIIESYSVHATKYYFSSITGDDTRSTAQASQMNTPWKSIAKLNAIFPTLISGDTVFLQCGSVFTGTLRITQSGISGRPIVITSYGTGASPIVNGFATLTGWTAVGGNIWQSPCVNCGIRVSLVSVADTLQPMGRYPNRDAANGGYAVYQTHTDSTGITDINLGSGANWTAADIVIRKNRFVIERDSIISHSGNSIKFKSGSSVVSTDNFGYFIQNSVKTLDQNGEWYYDPKTGKINMYLTSDPTSIVIKASQVDTLVTISNRQYISFAGINFQGSNKEALYISQSNYISFTNCNIRFSGINGVKCIQSNNITLQGVTIDYASNNGIDLNGSRNLVQDCSILRTGIFPGLGNAINSYQGISIRGDNNTVKYCRFDSTGYTPVQFVGSSTAIQYNLIDYFAFVKDDGGAIYTWSMDIDPTVRRVTGWITSNIILNGVTVSYGTDGKVAGIAHGIYLDENTQIANITGNTVANCTAGIFIQDSHELTVQGNTFFNNTGQVCLRHALDVGILKNNDFSGNIGVALSDNQNILQASSVSTVAGPPALTAFASMHDNKYVQMSGSSYFYLMAMKGLNTTGSFALWKANYGMDWNSFQLPVYYPPFTVNSLIGSDLYTYSSSITTDPFKIALINTRVIISKPIGPIQAGKAYVTHFTLHAPDAAHTLLLYMQQSISPYTHYTPVIGVTSASPQTNNTVVFDNTTGANASGALVFQVNLSDPRIYIDNIDLYMANVTKNDPNDNYQFKYNATKSPIVFALTGSYQDAGGKAYSGNITLQPYSSIVLFKK